MTRQPFFAVRVTIAHADGSTSTRDYVRGETRMGRARFEAFALGDLLMLVTKPGSDPISWSVTPVTFATVQENRQFHHTTH